MAEPVAGTSERAKSGSGSVEGDRVDEADSIGPICRSKARKEGLLREPAKLAKDEDQQNFFSLRALRLCESNSS